MSARFETTSSRTLVSRFHPVTLLREILPPPVEKRERERDSLYTYLECKLACANGKRARYFPCVPLFNPFSSCSVHSFPSLLRREGFVRMLNYRSTAKPKRSIVLLTAVANKREKERKKERKNSTTSWKKIKRKREKMRIFLVFHHSTSSCRGCLSLPQVRVLFAKVSFSVITRFGAWETALNSVLYASTHRHIRLYASSGSRPTMSIIPYHPLIANVFHIASFRCYVCHTKQTDNSHVDVRINTKRNVCNYFAIPS